LTSFDEFKVPSSKFNPPSPSSSAEALEDGRLGGKVGGTSRRDKSACLSTGRSFERESFIFQRNSPQFGAIYLGHPSVAV
jgi:hypothetical protein